MNIPITYIEINVETGEVLCSIEVYTQFMREKLHCDFENVFYEHVSLLNVIRCKQCGTVIFASEDEYYEANLRCPTCSDYKTGYEYWTKEEKLNIVNMHVLEGKSLGKISKENNIAKGMIGKWVTQYLAGGEQALENQKKPGNPLVKYQRRKELTKLEELEFENMKLRIENERLKKGYIVKGDGSVVIFK